MEAVQEKTPEVIEPTAKQMAEEEAINAERARKLIELRNNEKAQADAPEVTLIEVASRGYDALHEAFARHNETSKPKEYVPPPRTPRQMSVLQEELEAGRQAQARAQAQLDARPPPERDPNEGFTNPVYRPGTVVPDPTLPGTAGAIAGTRDFGPDA